MKRTRIRSAKKTRRSPKLPGRILETEDVLDQFELAKHGRNFTVFESWVRTFLLGLRKAETHPQSCRCPTCNKVVGPVCSECDHPVILLDEETQMAVEGATNSLLRVFVSGDWPALARLAKLGPTLLEDKGDPLRAQLLAYKMFAEALKIKPLLDREIAKLVGHSGGQVFNRMLREYGIPYETDPGGDGRGHKRVDG